MMSHPNLYRGAQYKPHPHGLIIRQADLELAPGVGYNGCVSVLQVGIGDADAGKGMECGSLARISLEPGVRYGDCLVLQRITVSDAESGAGLLCDPTRAGKWDAAAISALTGQSKLASIK